MRKRWILTTAGILAAVTLAAVIWPGHPAEAIVPSGLFIDDDGRTLEADIDALGQSGITRGCNPPANTHFCPTTPVSRGEMAAFLYRALGLPTSNTNQFTDDNGHLFESEINAIAAAGITRGCNPPANTRFCPDRTLSRGEMAALLVRALNLPFTNSDYFVDDETSTFEREINALAEGDITRGCNPPTNDRFCPNNPVTREQMAGFLVRALDLPPHQVQLPMGGGSGVTCNDSGRECRVTYDVSSRRVYRIEEGFFLVDPARPTELGLFMGSSTRPILRVDDVSYQLTQLPIRTENGFRWRLWDRRGLTFSPGIHTIEIWWRWNNDIVQHTIATIRSN